jgi:endonuclease YncB( thermonuclease family)
VVDEDTLELMDAKRIRLWGIDAPEGAQTCVSVPSVRGGAAIMQPGP